MANDPALAELKIVVAGPMGAGKTTLVGALSDTEVVRTEAASSEAMPGKDTTTVAMDYGRRCIQEGLEVAFYGTPGQDRFDFMWRILARNAFGVIMMVSADAADAEEELDRFLATYEELLGGVPTVIAVTRVDLAPEAFDRLSASAGACYPTIPVLPIDPRQTDSAVLTVEALLAQVDSEGSEVLDRLHQQDTMTFRVA